MAVIRDAVPAPVSASSSVSTRNSVVGKGGWSPATGSVAMASPSRWKARSKAAVGFPHDQRRFAVVDAGQLGQGVQDARA